MLHHLRDSIRHGLMLLLVTGTIAGTVYTFSDGAITLAGAAERLISVGGIALALELGVLYLAWHMGQLDQRLKAARRAATIAALRAQLRALYWYFGVVAAISAVANFLFRLQQLRSVPLAIFVALAPIALIWVFGVVLRPLPEDYRDIGARATGRALTRMVREAEGTLLRAMRHMAKGRAIDMRQVLFAASVVRIYAQTDEQHALDHALSLAAPAPASDVEATADPWLRTEDLMHRYGISRRTAQARMLNISNRRRVPNSNAWEAPASAVLAAYGPALPRNARREALPDAEDAQPLAALTLASAEDAPVGARQTTPTAV